MNAMSATAPKLIKRPRNLLPRPRPEKEIRSIPRARRNPRYDPTTSRRSSRCHENAHEAGTRQRANAWRLAPDAVRAVPAAVTVEVLVLLTGRAVAWWLGRHGVHALLLVGWRHVWLPLLWRRGVIGEGRCPNSQSSSCQSCFCRSPRLAAQAPKTNGQRIRNGALHTAISREPTPLRTA